MDNRETQEFKPAVEPYVRTRRSAAARAAALQMQNSGQQNAAPAVFSRPQAEAEQAPAVRKRSVEQTLTAPVTYEPSRQELRTPSVEPVNFSDAGSRRGRRSMKRFIFLSILIGLASGILLYFIHEQNQLLSEYGLSFRGSDWLYLSLLCGGGLGLICSLILSPVYKRLSSSLPVYASLLFLPVLLFLLMPLMIKGTQFVFAFIGAAIGVLGTIIVLFLMWTSLCGG